MAQRKPRPIKTPALGALLIHLRGARKNADVCRRIQAYGLTCDKSQLLKYERGEVRNPDPAILWALAQIYQLDSADALLSTLAQDRTHRKQQHIVVPPVARFSAEQLRCAEQFGLLTLDQQQYVMDGIRLLRRESRQPFARRKVRRHAGRLHASHVN